MDFIYITIIQRYHNIVNIFSHVCHSPSLSSPSLRGHLCPRQSPTLTCHCEGIYARGNLGHGTCTVAFPFSCRGLLRYARNDGYAHCHCEGIYARGNLGHGACTVAFPFSCRGLLRFARNDGVTYSNLRFPSLRLSRKKPRIGSKHSSLSMPPSTEAR